MPFALGYLASREIFRTDVEQTIDKERQFGAFRELFGGLDVPKQGYWHLVAGIFHGKNRATEVAERRRPQSVNVSAHLQAVGSLACRYTPLGYSRGCPYTAKY